MTATRTWPNLHAREDLLLDHYSWVDQSQGKVRIPIERAMELIAQRGLPVAAQPAQQEPLMAGDSVPAVQCSADQRICAHRL